VIPFVSEFAGGGDGTSLEKAEENEVKEGKKGEGCEERWDNFWN